MFWVLERNLALEKFKGIFQLKYAILSFGKCPNNLISGFQRGDIFFLNCDDTELETFSKVKFSAPERHCWAVVG